MTIEGIGRRHHNRHQDRRRDRQPRGAADRARGRLNRRAARGYARRQAPARDRRHRRVRGTPRHRTGQVLRAAVAVGSRGRELLRRALGNGRVRRRHRNRHQCAVTVRPVEPLIDPEVA